MNTEESETKQEERNQFIKKQVSEKKTNFLVWLVVTFDSLIPGILLRPNLRSSPHSVLNGFFFNSTKKRKTVNRGGWQRTPFRLCLCLLLAFSFCWLFWFFFFEEIYFCVVFSIEKECRWLASSLAANIFPDLLRLLT